MLQRAKDTGVLRPTLSVEETVEWVLRIVLSLLTVSGSVRREGPALRAFIRRFLVDGLLAPAPAASSG